MSASTSIDCVIRAALSSDYATRKQLAPCHLWESPGLCGVIPPESLTERPAGKKILGDAVRLQIVATNVESVLQEISDGRENERSSQVFSTPRGIHSIAGGVNPRVAWAKRRLENFPAALILAGGLGKRLRSAYAAGPKTLAPVGTRPFLDYLLHWLRAEGVEEVILCVGYKRSRIRRHVGSGRKWGLRVRYSIERKLLGTAGAVKKAGEMLVGERVFVINGDTFLDVNLREMTAFHRDQKGWATLAVAKVADARRFGTLQLDSRGRVTLFQEKSVSNMDDARACSGRQINGGVYLFEKKLLSRIPARRQVSLEKEVFPHLLPRKKLFGFVTDGFFLDIGVPDDFRRAQSELPKRFRISDSL